MKAHQFLSTVPKALRIAACAIVCCAVLIGVVVGITHGHVQGCRVAGALGGLLGMGTGLLVGSLAAIWLLCLGYVYADARRRAMPAVHWTLIALLVPNLLGFLFYFALRRPLLPPCTQCGQPGQPGRFCPSCGFDKLSSTSGSTPSASAHTGLGSNPT
jgi:Phospholipase_D-nuclease N-terminal